jgi:hypothetical protein
VNLLQFQWVLQGFDQLFCETSAQKPPRAMPGLTYHGMLLEQQNPKPVFSRNLGGMAPSRSGSYYDHVPSFHKPNSSEY